MAKITCILCNEKLEQEHGKLKGTILKVKDEKNKNQFIHVCDDCQKKKEWINEAKIKGV